MSTCGVDAQGLSNSSLLLILLCTVSLHERSLKLEYVDGFPVKMCA